MWKENAFPHIFQTRRKTLFASTSSGAEPVMKMESWMTNLYERINL